MFALSKPEVHGLDTFLDLLMSRRDPAARKRGLLTGTQKVKH